MSHLKNKITQLGAVLAISSVALLGCTATEEAQSPEASSSSTQEAAAGNAETAASFANLFFAALIEDDSTDYSSLTPPVELTDAQAEQLLLDGKVDGVTPEKLEELVDFLYEEHKLGEFIHFDDKATVQDRLRTISALIIAQDYAETMSTEQAPKKISASDVKISSDGKNPLATFEANAGSLAPTLIFVNDEWKVDGQKLLKSFMEPEAPADSATAAPSAAPSASSLPTDAVTATPEVKPAS